MKDGIYFGLPEELYFSEDRIGSTDLRTLIDSPGKFWFESFMNPLKRYKESKAMNDGKLFHKLLLEGEKAFERDYVIAPNIHTATKEYKTWKSCQTKTIVKEEDFKNAKYIIDFLKQPGQLLTLDFFKNGFPEVSILWTDSSGLKRRSRIDYLRLGSFVDLKTFVSSAWDDDLSHIGRYFWKYRVFIQLLDYIDALKTARNLEVVKGTKKQIEFWERCREFDDWLPFICFVNRDIPQFIIKTFQKNKCPELFQRGEELIKRAHDNFEHYFKEFGATHAWIEKQDVDSLQFTDFDFPQMMSL